MAEDTVEVRHRFTMEDPSTGTSTGAEIVMPLADYQALTPEQVIAKKLDMVAAWNVKRRADPVPLTAGELAERIERCRAQIAILQHDLAVYEVQQNAQGLAALGLTGLTPGG
jgi:hypothetical protein